MTQGRDPLSGMYVSLAAWSMRCHARPHATAGTARLRCARIGRRAAVAILWTPTGSRIHKVLWRSSLPSRGHARGPPCGAIGRGRCAKCLAARADDNVNDPFALRQNHRMLLLHVAVKVWHQNGEKTMLSLNEVGVMEGLSRLQPFESIARSRVG